MQESEKPVKKESVLAAFVCRMAALKRLIRPTEYATCWPVPDGGAKAPYPAYEMRNL
ncbi:hypothetical protein CKO_03559 [Citrobacter koseri ATCC BAA-895]|uniref:Uncharacterized protein n=1 Tax=Citrobacter koseri (strain ATCC BAA-895 / CDC 4225-83 / SGSC4696) TaxID=290338 RepID=A8AMC5_CITK8|nr:hypothetical protein CKO_03559 [Citrobacter koseri ATCC BAA-895]